jgi:hypothetical protein
MKLKFNKLKKTPTAELEFNSILNKKYINIVEQLPLTKKNVELSKILKSSKTTFI